MNVWLARRGKFMTLALLAALLVQLWAPARAWGEGACPGPSDEFCGRGRVGGMSVPDRNPRSSEQRAELL